jgi:hypothetical protein
VALYQTPLKLLGGYYAVGAAIPYVWMRVKAKGEVKNPPKQEEEEVKCGNNNRPK